MNSRIVEAIPIREQVADIIRKMIVNGELKADQQISEREISQMLMVSTTPVKEAFRVLQSEGLLYSIPRKGSYISKLSRKNILQTVFMRGALEGVAAFFAARNATYNEIMIMEEAHMMMGRDSLIYGALSYGATGAVAATANVAPKLVSSIYNKYQEGDLEGALEAQYKLLPLRIAFGLGSFPTVIKEALELLGIEAGPCAMPTGIMTTEEKVQLKNILIEMEILK